jgi:hypothetical protein
MASAALAHGLLLNHDLQWVGWALPTSRRSRVKASVHHMMLSQLSNVLWGDG